jgi:hypothetical protein
MNSPAYIPYTASLRAFLFAAYDDGLVELELACADGHRYRWEPVAPNPTYSAPERPDPSPWRVINLTDGAEFHSLSAPARDADRARWARGRNRRAHHP